MGWVPKLDLAEKGVAWVEDFGVADEAHLSEDVKQNEYYEYSQENRKHTPSLSCIGT